MRIPGSKLIRRAVAPLSKTLMPGAVVLGYHRIARVAWDPLALAVTPENFNAHVECLRELVQIVTLSELADRRHRGERLDGYAALTFDDGYRDFAETVLPLLEAHRVPATVFIATGFAGEHFWWDEIAALLGAQPSRKAPLEITRGETRLQRYDDLHRDDCRARAARDICHRLACAGKAEIAEALAQVRAWATEAEAPLADARAMSWRRLAGIGRHPLVQLGAHTASHGCLAKLMPEAQRAEIEQSRRDLEAHTGAHVSVFSYPNGSCSRVTRRTVAALGFVCACTSKQAALTRWTDRYRIPRVWPPDAPPSQFRRWLGTWLETG